MNFADFPIGPFFFSTGGVIVLVGVIISTWMLTRTVHEKGLSLSFLNDRLLFFALIGFIIGRLGSLGRFWSYFSTDSGNTEFWEQTVFFLKKFFLFWHGGVDPFWTSIAFLITFLILAFAKRENVWKWLDAFVLPTLLVLMFWSLGAFFSGWDYGIPVSDGYPLGVTYDMLGIRYSVPIHPVQMYAFVYYCILFIIGLQWWERHFSKREGTFFGTMVLFVFLGNGLLEFFRGDSTMMVYVGFGEMRAPQLVSFILVFIAIFFLIFHTHPEMLHHEQPKRKKKKAS